jgi:hypothetical protein
MRQERGWIAWQGGAWYPGAAPPDERYANLAAALRVAGLFEDAKSVEHDDYKSAAALYRLAMIEELRRREAARSAGIFAEHEIETDTLAEIERRLGRCLIRCARLQTPRSRGGRTKVSSKVSTPRSEVN